MAMVMVAETAGLMGVSLNAAPVGGRKIFSFPEVKETMNFTTEPAHRKKLTVCVGIYTARTDELTVRFTRPLSPGNPAAGHFHAGGGGVHPGVHAVGAEAVALAFDHGGHVGQKFFQRFDAQLQGLDIDGRWAGGCCGCGHGGAFFDS